MNKKGILMDNKNKEAHIQAVDSDEIDKAFEEAMKDDDLQDVISPFQKESVLKHIGHGWVCVLCRMSIESDDRSSHLCSVEHEANVKKWMEMPEVARINMLDFGWVPDFDFFIPISKGEHMHSIQCPKCKYTRRMSLQATDRGFSITSCNKCRYVIKIKVGTPQDIQPEYKARLDAQAREQRARIEENNRARDFQSRMAELDANHRVGDDYNHPFIATCIACASDYTFSETLHRIGQQILLRKITCPACSRENHLLLFNDPPLWDNEIKRTRAITIDDYRGLILSAKSSRSIIEIAKSIMDIMDVLRNQNKSLDMLRQPLERIAGILGGTSLQSSKSDVTRLDYIK